VVTIVTCSVLSSLYLSGLLVIHVWKVKQNDGDCTIRSISVKYRKVFYILTLWRLVRSYGHFRGRHICLDTVTSTLKIEVAGSSRMLLSSCKPMWH